MTESGYFANDFNGHSEKSVEFRLKGFNRLADGSEWKIALVPPPIATTTTIAAATATSTAARKNRRYEFTLSATRYSEAGRPQ
jgi:hypothetical protein